jgi:2-dehydro-3-deoxyphosphooctonate aldolase (KDO 8-P synthase)
MENTANNPVNHPARIGPFSVGGGAPLLVISGPCVLESESLALTVAETLRDIAGRLGVQFLFKSSYDKANRTSLDSFRGPGLTEGLAILDRVRRSAGVPVISDIHGPEEARPAAEVLDVLQIPAFLCRQTDLLAAAARAGKPVNIKKGQFLAPWDMVPAVGKVREAGNDQILLTERGSCFGYNNLVVDFRSIPILQEKTGCPVIFDATHSVQLPGGAGTASAGQREYAPVLARAAVAAGADGVFLEVHPDPDKARCDGPNSIPLDRVEDVLRRLVAIREALA